MTQCEYYKCEAEASTTHTFDISSDRYPTATATSNLCTEHAWISEADENFGLYHYYCNTVKGQTMRTIVITIPVADYVSNGNFANLLSDITQEIENMQLHEYSIKVVEK